LCECKPTCLCCCGSLTISSFTWDLLLVETANTTHTSQGNVMAAAAAAEESHLEQLGVRLAAGHEGRVQRVGWQRHVICVLRVA
jgi:hypothetical protein